MQVGWGRGSTRKLPVDRRCLPAATAASASRCRAILWADMSVQALTASLGGYCAGGRVAMRPPWPGVRSLARWGRHHVMQALPGDTYGSLNSGFAPPFRRLQPASGSVVFPCAVKVSELLSESGELFMVTVTENDPQGGYASYWMGGGQRGGREGTEPSSILASNAYGCVYSLRDGVAHLHQLHGAHALLQLQLHGTLARPLVPIRTHYPSPIRRGCWHACLRTFHICRRLATSSDLPKTLQQGSSERWNRWVSQVGRPPK